jgi:hypothetical protein
VGRTANYGPVRASAIQGFDAYDDEDPPGSRLLGTHGTGGTMGAVADAAKRLWSLVHGYDDIRGSRLDNSIP